MKISTEQYSVLIEHIPDTGFIRFDKNLDVLQSRDHEIDYDENYGNYEEDVESLEAAIFEFGNFIDGIIQLMGEEMENLRSLVEKVDRTD